MCIRDRNNAYNIADAEAAVLAKSLPEDPAVIIDETFAEATADVAKAYSTAVSYTHLDVYKRQVLDAGDEYHSRHDGNIAASRCRACGGHFFSGTLYAAYRLCPQLINGGVECFT